MIVYRRVGRLVAFVFAVVSDLVRLYIAEVEFAVLQVPDQRIARLQVEASPDRCRNGDAAARENGDNIVIQSCTPLSVTNSIR